MAAHKQENEDLRKKNSEYEELEHIFDKKDAELKNMNDLVQELRLSLQKEKMANKNLTDQAEAAVTQLKQELARHEDNPETDKLRRKLETSEKALGDMTVRMKDEKNLLANLKERCLVLEESVKTLQNDKMELVLQISEREEEKKRLLQRLEDAESRHKKDLEEKEQFARSMKDSHREPLGM
jgi:chromosome segregation ATPase